MSLGQLEAMSEFSCLLYRAENERRAGGGWGGMVWGGVFAFICVRLHMPVNV